MKIIGGMNEKERSGIIRIVADESRMHEAVIEKDFWVCYTLSHLFHACSFKESLIFKGGTSLSKAYGLIDRFSEDIDLILDWRRIGYGVNEPWEERSNTQQDKFRREVALRTNYFLERAFVPELKKSMEIDLGFPVNIYRSNEDKVVIFEYPRYFYSESTLDIIRLEIGPLAAWTPYEIVSVKPHLAEKRPELFSSPNTRVATVKPERTFWEKSTILHQEAMRPETKKIPLRYSRHYYDLFRLGHSHVKDAAYVNLDILAKVVSFKEKFYRSPWSQLGLATPGTLKLVPPDYRFRELEKDFHAMQAMLFGENPSFDEIISYLEKLESEINAL